MNDHAQLPVLSSRALAALASRAGLFDPRLFRCLAKGVQLDAAWHGFAVGDLAV